MLFYKKTMAFAVVTVLICLCTTHTHTAAIQPQVSDVNAVSAAIDSFSIKLLAKTSELSKGALNLALSPYTIWTLMAIIHEGAQNNTAEELERALGIPPCEQACKYNFKQSYRTLFNSLSEKAKDIVLTLANGVFVENTFPLNPEFEGVVRNVYNVNVLPIDFRDKQEAAKDINQYLTKQTGRLIGDFVNAGDFEGTNIFLTSALYFKGFWQTPFNKTATKKAQFFDKNHKPLGEVDMMYLKTPLPFTTIFDKKATVVELKYGDGDRMSMIVVVPKWKSSLTEILALLAETPIGVILKALTDSAATYLDENVVVHLPRFKIKSDLVMNGVLVGMGITDLFNVGSANLLGISPTKDLYVSRVVQRAVIDVDEEGTVAAAAGGASISNKSPPGVLNADRPFAYFIVDKPSQTVLFAGTVQNPNIGR